MPNVLGSALATRVRDYADQPSFGDAAKSFISDSMIYSWLSNGVRDMYRACGRQGVFLNVTRQENTAPGASITFSSETGVLAVLGVYWYDTTARYPLPRVTGIVGPVLTGNTARYWRPNIDSTGVFTISLYPGETANRIETYYIPDHTGIDADTNQYFPAGWDEVVVLKAALKAQARDKERHAQLEELYKDALLEAEATLASMQPDTVVRNTDGFYAPGYDQTISEYDIQSSLWWAP